MCIRIELDWIGLDESVYGGRTFLLPKNLYNKIVYFKITSFFIKPTWAGPLM